MKFVQSLIAASLFFSASVFAVPPLNGPFTTNATGQIVDKNNQPVSLHGLSWFGFNTSNHVVHGLWQSDFDTMVKQIKSLGFNAVRLPIQFDFVNDPSIQPSGINTSCGAPNSCNLDVPTDSALHTLQWVVTQFTNDGIFVLIDDHYEDTTYEQNPTQWINDWKQIATLFKSNPLVGYDLLNEPDSHGITWEGTSGGPALGNSYLTVANAIYAIDPNKLILIEGTGQGTLESNWGDGFATDDQTVKAGISNPKNFFTQLLSQPVAKQIVISPHLYGPDGTNGDGPDESNYAHASVVWSRLFGYLNNTGFCLDDGTCHIFPISVGEFGGKFDPTDPYYKQDVATNTNIATFIMTNNKNNPPNYFYWDWNPDSGNTNGILDNDWKTIDCTKVKFLKNNLLLNTDPDVC